jgi:hypothetical protein
VEFLWNRTPTPSALRGGRITLVVLVVVFVIGVASILLVPGFGDTQFIAVMAATGVMVVGDATAYLGQPTVTRYRLGLAITTIGIVLAFWFWLANPFPPAA